MVMIVTLSIEKTLSSFVRTKPRGSDIITKPLALRMSLCVCSGIYFVVMNYIPL